MTWSPLRALLLLSLLYPLQSWSFDYLEHSFFSDQACFEAQKRLVQRLKEAPSDPLLARYLALSLFCPQRWDRPYCLDEYKQLEGSINLLAEPPVESGDHPITLGDIVALPDHLSLFGPVRGHPRAVRPGLSLRLMEWMSEPGDAGGVEADVAEDACETEEPVPWAQLREQLSQALAAPLETLPKRLLQDARRAPAPFGPHDPPTAHSFDNPHYLDLVLRNHHHFGAEAYGAWLGFHGVAQEILRRGCRESMGIDPEELEDLSEDHPPFEALDWEELKPTEGRALGCALLGQLILEHLGVWFQRADPQLTQAVSVPLQALLDQPKSPRSLNILEQSATALLSLIMEGSGLHFLQDSFAGGHIRTDRGAWGLSDSRYVHNRDNQHGVITGFATAIAQQEFMAYGDRYLLAPPLLQGPLKCTQARRPQEITECLLRHQRALLVGASVASLLQWAEGPNFEDPSTGCSSPGIGRFICERLPTQALRPPDQLHALKPALAAGTLPTPPPPFAYQSILFSYRLRIGEDQDQSGLRLVFLSELDDFANWMTSYQFGVNQGEGLEFAFLFHWRWAARFLVNAGPYLYAGESSGLGPRLGFSFLPEGWTQIPLEIDLGYRLPFRLMKGSDPGFQFEGHWLELAIGLAFM